MILERKKTTLLCIALLFVMTLLFFAPVVFSSKTFISRDHYVFFNPRRFFAAETIRQEAALPLWNPYIACGVPFQANLQSSVFYPPSLLYYVLPFQKGFKYFVVLHYFIGALCMFLLMRQWKSTRWEALLAAVVFAFGGYLVSINDNVAFLTAGVWLPLVLVCHHRALERGSFFYALVTAMVIGLQVFAGDASFYLLASLICTCCYTLLWPFIRGPGSARAGARPWALLGTAWVPGLLLASVQILPFIEFVLNSVRIDGVGFDRATKWSYHPLELIQLIVPYFGGTTVPETRWFGQYWLDTFYIGIFPLICAILFFVCAKDRIKIVLGILLAVGILLSFGKYNPLYEYLYRFLPGLNMVTYPVKFLFIGSFVLAVAAGKGMGSFWEMCRDKKSVQRFLTVLAVPTLVLAAFVVSGSLLQQELYDVFSSLYPKTEYLEPYCRPQFYLLLKDVSAALVVIILFVLIAWAAGRGRLGRQAAFLIVIVITCADLTFIGKPREPIIDESAFLHKGTTVQFLEEDTSVFRIYTLSRFVTQWRFQHVYYLPFEQVYRVCQDLVRANLNMYNHIYSVEECSAVLSRPFYDVFLPAEYCFAQGRTELADIDYCKNVLNLLNIRYILSPYALDGYGFNLVKDGKPKIYENPTALPRVFFARECVVADTQEGVLEMMKGEGFDPEQKIYISRAEAEKIETPSSDKSPSPAGEPLAWTASFNEYTPNRITLETETDRYAFLVFSDNYYPGWKAFVDGREVPVLRVDHTLKGIAVEQGVHRIEFVFQPAVLTIGACISIGALFGICLGLYMLYNRRKRKL